MPWTTPGLSWTRVAFCVAAALCAVLVGAVACGAGGGHGPRRAGRVLDRFSFSSARAAAGRPVEATADLTASGADTAGPGGG